MASVYTDLGKLAHERCKGNAKLAPLAALLDARKEIIDVHCSQVGNEMVPFTLLEAMERKRKVDIQVAGYRYAFDRNTRGAEVLEVDGGNELLLVLEGPLNSQGVAGDAPSIPSRGDYAIRVDDSRTLIQGSYDLSDAEEQALRGPGASKRPKVGFLKRISLQSLQAQGVAVKEKLALVELELYVTYVAPKRGGGPAKPVLQAVVLRVVMRPSRERLTRPTLTRTDRRGMMPSDTQRSAYKAPASSLVVHADERRKMADAMLGKFVERGDAFSLVVVRRGQRLLDIESEHGRTVYSAGEMTQVLTTAAVVKHLLSRDAAHAAGEVNMHSRRMLGDLLSETGAEETRQALAELYQRSGEQLPSMAQLMTHTSGLPARAQLGLRDLQAMFADRGGLDSGDQRVELAGVHSRIDDVSLHCCVVAVMVTLCIVRGESRGTD